MALGYSQPGCTSLCCIPRAVQQHVFRLNHPHSHYLADSCLFPVAQSKVKIHFGSVITKRMSLWVGEQSVPSEMKTWLSIKSGPDSVTPPVSLIKPALSCHTFKRAAVVSVLVLSKQQHLGWAFASGAEWRWGLSVSEKSPLTCSTPSLGETWQQSRPTDR